MLYNKQTGDKARPYNQVLILAQIIDASNKCKYCRLTLVDFL